MVIHYLMKVSGYSRQQLTQQYRQTGALKRRQRTVQGFARRYNAQDIGLLAAMDERHDTPCGPAVKKLCERHARSLRRASTQRWPRSPSVICTTCGNPPPIQGGGVTSSRPAHGTTQLSPHRYPYTKGIWTVKKFVFHINAVPEYINR